MIVLIIDDGSLTCSGLSPRRNSVEELIEQICEHDYQCVTWFDEPIESWFVPRTIGRTKRAAQDKKIMMIRNNLPARYRARTTVNNDVEHRQ